MRAPLPSLAIGCGGMAGSVLAALRRKSMRVVQVQNPRMDIGRFDLIIANHHDELTGRNVFVTRTALHRVTPERLAAEAEIWRDRLAPYRRPLVAVPLGGTNGRYRLDRNAGARLAADLATMAQRDKVGVVVTPSRRTDPAVTAMIRTALAPSGGWVWNFDGENPYFGMLALADLILVTQDSVSMISEAAATTAPVMVAPLPGSWRRQSLFLKPLIDQDRIRPFQGQFLTWKVSPLNDTPLSQSSCSMCRRPGALEYNRLAERRRRAWQRWPDIPLQEFAMLRIQTFDAKAGGNVIYKALAHPLAAEAIERLYARLDGPVALYDPDGIADALVAMYPADFEDLFVHDVTAVGQTRVRLTARPLTEIGGSDARTVLVAAFDADTIVARIAHMIPDGAALLTLDGVRLPDSLLTSRVRYLDKLNFATNFAFFRDADGLHTRLVSANYWAGYGASNVRLWLRLFGADGTVLATWGQILPSGPGGFSIDSRQVRERFALAPFTGQLFIHAVGVAGHDVVKYALDTYASDNGASLSCTHDANAWPSDRFAGLPAPRPHETVILWLQNSHAVPIPAGTVSLDRMGAEKPVYLSEAVRAFATVAMDVADYLPGLRWPAQIEIRAGRHVVRPRYEITQNDRVRIAHVNVERDNLRNDPNIPTLPDEMAGATCCPSPSCLRRNFELRSNRPRCQQRRRRCRFAWTCSMQWEFCGRSDF